MRISCCCHKSEALNPKRTKPQVRAEVAGFIGEIFEGRIGNRGSMIWPVRRLLYSPVVKGPQNHGYFQNCGIARSR
jgi:hypothetical protein